MKIKEFTKTFVAFTMGVLTLVSEIYADPPYIYPDISKRFIGVQVATKEEAQKRFEFSKPPSRKGVFVTMLAPGSALENLPDGSIITKVNSKPIDTPEKFVEAVQSAPADFPIELEILRSMKNSKNRLYWESPKKLQAKPMTYGSWTTELTSRTKDDFLNEWIEMRSELTENLQTTDLKLKIELVKNDIGNLYWFTSYHGEFWIFVESLSIRVGDAIYKFEVNPVRTVLKDATVLESCFLAADEKSFNMIRDVAFGTGEVAVAFHGRNKTIAEPMSESGRTMFQLMSLSYIERGGDGLKPPTQAKK